MRKSIIGAMLLLGALGAPAGAGEMQIQENAPDRYIVVPGDTLWGIAGKFLKEPWRWPDIWKLNREQIKNPHRIYPGDVIVLDRAGLGLSVRPVAKLTPQTRVSRLDRDAIPSIPSAAIEPFLSQPLVIEEGEPGTAEVVATKDEHVVVGAGSQVYVRGIKEGQDNWNFYRKGKALVDPETGKTLGYEAIYLGAARVARHGDPATVNITRSTQEILRGDRLVAVPQDEFITYVPHAPEKKVDGRVISVYGGVAEAGRYSVITLNRGRADGLERGHVVALHRAGEKIALPQEEQPTLWHNVMRTKCLKPDAKVSFDKYFDADEAYGPCDQITKPAGPTHLTAPEERYGVAFIFRTFDHVSYAMVMNADKPVLVLDTFQNP